MEDSESFLHREYLYPTDDIKQVIKEYIKWRSYRKNKTIGNVFKTFLEFDKHAENKFGTCMYSIVKSMKLTIQDGPRMDKIDLTNSTIAEIIGLCAKLSEYLGKPLFDVSWELVFDTLFDALKNYDLDTIKMSLYTYDDKQFFSNKFM
ncbi:anti-apoptotic Bcl-2-like protein [Hypsugopox virus]|nr:anti-apoptotic Bcl-2-like protein [Hypsugopox virus]